MVPDIVNKVLSFELKNSNRAIANAIRRTLVSEVTVRYLTVSLNDIHSTDTRAWQMAGTSTQVRRVYVLGT